MAKRLFSIFFICASALLFCDEPDRIQKYLQFAKQHAQTFGQLGGWKSNEIEIVLNPERIQKIEKQTASRLQAKGHSEKEAKLWSTVGIIAEDNYWIWIRDAVIFPSGVYGTYDRLMWKSGLDGTPCVAMLPILSNKKVIVNVAYRHATRSWEIELPRGRKKKEESNEHAAIRELREETGYKAVNCSLLGTMAPDSGVLMSVVPIFYAEVKHGGQTHKIYSEAIAQNPAFTKDEIKEGFLKGFIELSINGDPIKVHCRDPYLAFAILQAEMKHLL
jgi:ADP-ribose pyrophosphatase